MRNVLTFLLTVLLYTGMSQNKNVELQLIHYWDNYSFQNPSIFVEGDVILSYFCLLNAASYEISNESIQTTLSKASNNEKIFSLFIDTYRIYLFNPESYFCDYERYLAVVDYVINDENINKYAKFDFILEKEIIEANRVGELATNFLVYDKIGNIIELHEIKSDYTILFFNNPDCSICEKTKKKLAESEIVNNLIDTGRLKVISIYPGNDFELWESATFPDKWLNGYDKDLTINTQKLYYLLESSTLYLLDKDKRIIKKDVRFDVLEEYLEHL